MDDLHEPRASGECMNTFTVRSIYVDFEHMRLAVNVRVTQWPNEISLHYSFKANRTVILPVP